MSVSLFPKFRLVGVISLCLADGQMNGLMV